MPRRTTKKSTPCRCPKSRPTHVRWGELIKTLGTVVPFVINTAVTLAKVLPEGWGLWG